MNQQLDPRRRIHCALALALLLGCSLAAQDGRGPGGGRRGRPMPPLPVLTALDGDRDGALSAEELDGALAAILMLDRNGDRNLTRDELMPDMGRGRGGPGGPGGPRSGGPGGPGPGGAGPGGPGMGGMFDPFRGHPVMRALDKDGDGELFADEVLDASESLWRLDTNGDLRVAGEELAMAGRPGFGGPGPGGPGFGGPGGGRPGDSGGGRRYGAGVPAPEELDPADGVATIPDRASFETLSYQGEQVMIDTHLAGVEFVKFQIEAADGDAPRLYFMNTETHRAHPMFMRTVGIDERDGTTRMRGVLACRPTLRAPNGDAGLYTYEFEPNDAFPFDLVKVAFDLLRTKAPLLEGRLAYNLLPRAKQRWQTETERYEAAGLPTFDQDDVANDVGYQPLHRAVGFGRLRLMAHEERPTQRDVVVYRTLPNELPRVAGVITGVRQTPLSHVNLRAVQDRIPNAFVANAAESPAVQGLLGKYVRYEVRADGFELREATALEVEEHFASLRPEAPQVPARDLSLEEIVPFSALSFGDADKVGVKAANLAVLKKLGFADGRTPDGFAVPFAFYDAFMQHNGFYEMAREMLATPDFQKDADTRQKALAKFRKAIEKGKMPKWMDEAFDAVQRRFPKGTAIRCRSSTNNEDLPGFSGAGLYDSFTHKPKEGHLGKTIRQVYASLWNFRAVEEREFFRVDHLQAAMGVALHANSSAERANGVAVTKDVLFRSVDSGLVLYYVNAQVGEDLVTNPGSESVPEELLMSPRNPARDRVVVRSNRVADDARVLDDAVLLELRRSLRVVHEAFAALYGRSDDAEFAIEVEFKVEKGGSLLIKQARPWVE